eukprot:1395393-Amorphochlora_amoeboformis.AAC.1
MAVRGAPRGTPPRPVASPERAAIIQDVLYRRYEAVIIRLSTGWGSGLSDRELGGVFLLGVVMLGSIKPKISLRYVNCAGRQAG